MRATRKLLALALLGGAAACDNPNTPEPLERLPRALTAGEERLVAASNQFAFGLLREASRGADGDNVFLSPLSASMALGMTMNGARGATFDGMRQTLGFGSAPQEEINAAYRSYIDLLRGLDPAVQMDVANSIWAKQGFPFEQAFLDAGKTYFDAEVATLDFASPSAAAAINGWVKRETQGKIETIVDEIPAGMVMYLVNAVYFKGSWTDRFDPRETQPAPFHLADGTQKTVQMMQRSGKARLGGTQQYQAVDLPYGRGAFTMTVVVPNPGVTLDEVVAGLDDAGWKRLVDGLTEPQEMGVYLPRFRVEYEKVLNDALEALGMGVALDRGPVAPDFTGMSPEGRSLFISQVKQKTFVEVNEEGTEAAAATSVGVAVTSAPPVVRADRPFLLAIRERFSGGIIFLGRIESPPSN